MFGFLRRWLQGDVASTAAPKDLVTLERGRVAHLWHRPEGLPRVDWDMASRWIAEHAPDGADPAPWRRAVMAACLDQLRDELPTDHRRWRSRHVEGLGPMEGNLSPAMASAAERACHALRRDLSMIRDDAPIPTVAIVAITPKASYIDFTSSYFPDDGAFATSGGLYLNTEPDSVALIAVNAAVPWACEAAVAHELTHHALHGLNIPLWIEEGFTQLMEERVTGTCDFTLDPTQAARQRELWHDRDLQMFLDGHAFGSPDGDTQELAYHLSQWIVRSELTRRPGDFFRFVRACRDEDPDLACQRVLGVSQHELVATAMGLDE
jgi:hypothetical protein